MHVRVHPNHRCAMSLSTQPAAAHFIIHAITLCWEKHKKKNTLHFLCGVLLPEDKVKLNVPAEQVVDSLAMTRRSILSAPPNQKCVSGFSTPGVRSGSLARHLLGAHGC